MLLNELKEKLQTIKKGVFVKMQWKSNPKPYAKYKEHSIEKYSKGVVRLGIKYANLKDKKGKNIQPMLYGEYIENFDNYIIEYKGKYYLRVYVSKKHKTLIQYLLNGIETTKEYLVNNGIIPNYEKGDLLCFNVAIENIISLG